MATKKKSQSSLNIHEYANIQSIASSPFQTCNRHAIREELRSDDKGNEFPSYRELFKKTEGAGPVDHDSSILSPAAYFVDLMRLIETKITKGDQNNWEGLEDLKLENRRPDLWEIELDAKNTTTEVPYLEIVNEVMTNKLKTDPGKDPLQQLAAAFFPLNLPYNVPLERIRTYLAHFGVELADIYETFGQDNNAWVAEALGLSPLESSLIRSVTRIDLEAERWGKRRHWGWVKKFLTQTGLQADELEDLLRIKLPPYGARVIQDYGHSEPHFQNMDEPRTMDYLERFLRLSKRLGWTFADLDIALGSPAAGEGGYHRFESSNWNGALSKLVLIKKLSKKYKLPVDVLCSFEYEMSTTPGVANKPTKRSLFDRVFNIPSFYQPDGSAKTEYHPKGNGYPNSKTEPLPWDPQGQDRENQGIRSSLLAALNAGNDDLQAIVDHLRNNSLFDDNDCSKTGVIPLHTRTLTRLYRYSKMAQVLGLQVQEYLTLLRVITGKGKGTHRLESPEVSNLVDLSAVDYWADWLKDARLSPYQLEYLTTGTMRDEARHCFDPGWTQEGLIHFIAALHTTLEPRFIKLRSFAQGAISSEEAAGVVAALRVAGLVVDVAAIEANDGSSEFRGLVRCPLSGASSVPGNLPRISRRQVIDALAHSASPNAARDLVRLKVSFPDRQPGTGLPNADLKELAVLAEEVDKTIEVANKKEWNVDVGSTLRDLAKAAALHDPDAIAEAKAFRSEAEINQQQFEELCGLVTGDQLAEEFGKIESDVTAMAITLDGGLVYAGTAGGEIWVKDGSAAWKKSDLPDLQEKVSAIAVTPEGKTLFVASKDGVLHWTADNNKKWNNSKFPSTGYGEVIDFTLAATHDGKTVFAGTDDGIFFRTTGHGEDWRSAELTWSRSVSGDYNKVTAVTVGPDGRTLFAAIQRIKYGSGESTQAGVFRSCDGGETWEEIDVSVVTDFTVNALAITPGWRVLGVSATDGWHGDRGWESLRSLSKESISVSAVVVAPDGESVIAATKGGDVFRTWVGRTEGYFTPGKDSTEALAPFIHLAKKLEWSFTDLHYVLKRIEGHITGLESKSITQLSQIKLLQATLQIPPEVSSVFWKELWNAGEMAALDIPSPAQRTQDPATDHSPEDFERASKLAAISDELLSKAAAIGGITDTLNRELDFAMQSTIQQLASTFNQDWHLVASVVDDLNYQERGAAKFLGGGGLRDAALLLYQANVLGLTADGLDAVLKNPRLVGFDPVRSNIHLKLDTVRAVRAFSHLVESFEKQGSMGKNTASSLADLSPRWSLGDLKEAEIKTLSALSGWEESQVKALQEHLNAMSPSLSGVFALATMRKCFELAAKLGVDVQMLIQLCKLHDDTTGFDDYTAAAHSLLGVVKSKYADDQWEKTFSPIRDHLNERERDALVGLLVHQLREDKNNALATHFDGMDSLQDLSDYLLIDVEMSGVAKVSRVKQGLNTLQRYLQRCHMGLEADGKVTFPVADNEWSWRSHYRLWEANRKVFLYPENYLDPGLRKQKTPLYKELGDELLQGDVTGETVTDAYVNYFDKLDELASLEIVDGHIASVNNPKVREGERTIFVVARTSSNPALFYLRSAVLGGERSITPTSWSPWKKLDLTIPAAEVTLLYALDRLYIFWAEKSTKRERHKDGHKKVTTTATVKYSYQNVSGKWLLPQIIPGTEMLEESHDLEASYDEDDDGNRSNNKPFRIIAVPLPSGETVCDKSTCADKLVSTLLVLKDLSTLLYWKSGKPSLLYHEMEALKKKRSECGDKLNRHLHGGKKLPPKEREKLSNQNVLLNKQIGDFELDVRKLEEEAAKRCKKRGKILQEACGSTWIGKARGEPGIDQLRQRLVTRGLDSLLSPDSQSTGGCDGSDCPPEFALSDPYAIYFREIFFHIPFLIADTLNSNQRFEDAQKWYHYIFNPIAAKNGDEVWRYQLFREQGLNTLMKNLADKAQLAKYKDDPFDPHAIAGLRLGAYEKAIVMHYIDNLLDWGDQLFAQDSWESIVQAMLLYVMAQNLLGKRPKQTRPAHAPKPVKRYDEMNKKIELTDPFHVEDTKYFPVSANTNFTLYWDRAEDRLFKIRHSMNIKGIVRQLALFQPPIDPRQLIHALTAGGDLASVTSELSAPVPHYRFTTTIQQAKNVTSTLIQLGSALLSALEKKDAEQLNLLRSTHEKATLNLTTRVKKEQIKDAGKSLDSLNASLDAATNRRDHYRGLISHGLSRQEKTSLALTGGALEAQDLAHVVRGEAVAAHLIPTIFGFSDGGFQPGSSVSEAATLSDALAGIMNQRAGLATAQGQNVRRKEEWALQEALAGHDVKQIQAQIKGATIRHEIAQKDLEMHQTSIEQADEREEFLRGKFTNRDLYQWMVGRISSVYFQTYKIAFDLARVAEKAYQYERNTNDTLITFGYWDSLKKGLLAGEGLMLGLNQLEKAYMDDNERTLEIEKTISLRQIDPRAWLDLRNTGTCSFDLKESLFDRDFPGHYCRKIASIAISIPAIVGPYQNVQATLVQQTSRVVLTNDIEPVQYLLTGRPEPTAQQLRSDPRARQQIALSKGVNDSGLFELNFHDERYLPFEGTGAVSTWQLHMPKAANRIDFNSISDVIIHLRYTALDGGASLRDQVVKLDPIKKDTGARLISLRQEYAAEWQTAKAAAEFAVPIDKGMFPMNLTSLALGDIAMWTFAQGRIDIATHKPETEPVEAQSKWLIKVKVPKDGLDSVDDIYLLVPFTGELDWSTPG